MTGPRRLLRASLVGVLIAVFVGALPGIASAVPAQVTPLVDCYVQNSDGSYTVILGSQSTYSSTKSIPHGSNNYFTPSTYTAQLPTVFGPGRRYGVGSLTISQSDLYTGYVSWYLDGTRLDYWTVAQSAGACSSAQLPALANGGALAAVLLVAGAVGVVLVRRARRSPTVQR